MEDYRRFLHVEMRVAASTYTRLYLGNEQSLKHSDRCCSSRRCESRRT